MSTVGIIANPAAGKDIRRLVAQGRVVSNQEKSNTLRRVFAGLVSVGVERVLVMPDMSGLSRAAVAENKDRIAVEYVDMRPADTQADSTRAAKAMAEAGAGCIVTLGGDGTNRVVARGCGDTPLAAISTGTNNVFPQMVEGTLAGIAAGAVASGAVPVEFATRRSKRLDVLIDGELADIALVDAAVTTQIFVGARAVWDPASLVEMFLTRAEPASIGLSSIGSRLRAIAIDDPEGLYLRLRGDASPNATVVRAPVGPGMIMDIEIAEWKTLIPGQKRRIEQGRGTIALDGEREVELLQGRTVEIGLNPDGPLVVDIVRTNELLVTRQNNQTKPA